MAWLDWSDIGILGNARHCNILSLVGFVLGRMSIALLILDQLGACIFWISAKQLQRSHLAPGLRFPQCTDINWLDSSGTVSMIKTAS